MRLLRGADDVRSGRVPAAAPSSQRSAYSHLTPPTTEDAHAASSQRSRTAVDDHAFLLPSYPVISGCDLVGGSPSCIESFPTCNDGTRPRLVHPKRPRIS